MKSPHPPLTDYYAHEADRDRWVRSLFDRTAEDYDRIERAMSLGSGSWYRRRALERSGLREGMRVLDVGVGTGLTAREAARLVGSSGHVCGVDPSEGMLKSAIVPPNVELLTGSAEALPVDSNSVDFISMGYALRHVADFAVVFQEFKRVLVPGGHICLLEITLPRAALPRALLKAYLHGIVPFVARYFANTAEMPLLMRYYWDTIQSCAAPAEILTAISEAGFSDAQRTVSLGIFSEYCARKSRAETPRQ